MNTVTYVGNISSDLELKSTQSGKSVLSFSIAVRRPFAKDTTDFFRCTAWQQTAELIAKHFGKGDYIAVSGYNTTRTYDKAVGSETVAIPVVELQIDRISFCGARKSGQPSQTQPSTQSNPQPNQPHGSYQQATSPAQEFESPASDFEPYPF